MRSKGSICFVSLTAYSVLARDKKIETVGGAEVQQVLLAKALADKGYQVSMITMDHGQDDRCLISDVRVFKTYKQEQGIIPQIRFIYPRFVMLWRAMKRADADIYYQRGAGQLTWLVAFFCKSYKKRFVYCGASEDDFLNKPLMIKNAFCRWLYRRGIDMATKVLVQNSSQKGLCKKNYGREATIVSNGYDCANGANNDPAGYILWASTLRRWKKPEVFVEIAKKLPLYKFKMIGGMSKEEEPLYLKIKEQTKNMKNFEFVGFVPYCEVDRYFDGARLFVNTSEFEGFPNTFLQAWARAIPTLSFIDCGARQGDAPVGIIAGSLDEMLHKITDLMIDNNSWVREGNNCKTYFLKNCSRDSVVEANSHILQEIIIEKNEK